MSLVINAANQAKVRMPDNFLTRAHRSAVARGCWGTAPLQGACNRRSLDLLANRSIAIRIGVNGENVLIAIARRMTGWSIRHPCG